MPRFPMYLHRLLRDDGRRRRFVARHRRHDFGEHRHSDGRRYGPGRFIGRRHGAGGYRAHSHGTGRFRGQGIHIRSGAGSPPSLHRADENAVLALAAPPPAFWCSAHGWVICPLHEYGPAAGVDAGQSPTSVFDFGSTSAAVADANVMAPRLPSPTLAVVEIEGDALAFVSAPTGTSVFAFGSGVNGSSNHAVVDVDAVAPRLPSPTPATPPPSPRTGARRRLMALGVPLVSSPSSRRSGTWSPAALGLTNGVANGVSNGVASSHGLLGGSSSEEDGGAPGPSARRR